jgi:hypothetical protein
MTGNVSQDLKTTLLSLPKGMPVTTRHLAGWGISPKLAHYYVESGWLTSLSYGYYLRAGDELTLPGAVAAMQEQGLPVHVGGKTALEWQGSAHYVRLHKPMLHLYGIPKTRVPGWLFAYARWTAQPASLFIEPKALTGRLHVSRLEESPHSPYVSEPERAALEILDAVPNRQSLDEAEKLMENCYTLRPKVMQSLLEACNKVKVPRLFFYFATTLNLPVLAGLHPERINMGSASPYMLRVGGHTLVLKHPLHKN